jgi:NADH-quinone oxidoreductase subunit A
MLNEFAAVLLLGAIGAVMGLGMLAVPFIFAPRKPSQVKNEPFECGQEPVGTARTRLVMRYYPYIMIFLVVDVMSIFLFAWAIGYKVLGFSASIPVFAFIGVALAGVAYALSLARREELW